MQYQKTDNSVQGGGVRPPAHLTAQQIYDVARQDIISGEASVVTKYCAEYEPETAIKELAEVFTEWLYSDSADDQESRKTTTYHIHGIQKLLHELVMNEIDALRDMRINVMLLAERESLVLDQLTIHEGPSNK